MRAAPGTANACGLTALALTALVPKHAAAAQAAQTQPAETPTLEAQPAAAAPAGDIVVTARRSSERLQQVPLAVTAVSPEIVKSLNLTDTRDLTKVAPALGFVQGATTKLQNFVVRGVGTFVNSDGFDQSVGVAFDGVSLARPGGSIADLIDIERVEVLEGPQGMLFGRNASAGLINIISRKPQLGVHSLTGRLSYGSYHELKFDAAANLPVGDRFALRLVGWKSRHDGFVDSLTLRNDLGEKDSQGVRLRTTWEPNAAAQINLMGEYVSFDQDPVVTTLRQFTSNAAGVRDYELSRGIVPGPANNRTSSTADIYNRGHAAALSAEVQYDIGGPVVTALGSYRDIRVIDKFDPPATSSPIFLNDQRDDLRYDQKSLEVRVNSGPESKLKYVVGAIYFGFDLRNAFNLSQSGNVPTPVSFLAKVNQNSKHYALFGEVTYPLLPSLKVIAGARHSWDKIRGDLNRDYLDPPRALIPGFNTPGASFGPYAAASSVKDSEWSYRLGLQWQAARDIMLYGTISRGYKAAGLDLAATINSTIFNANKLRVAPEFSNNYEIGLRSQFFDRRLTFNVTAFHEVFTDFQIASRLPVPGVVFAITNAKELKSTGASVAIDARVTPELTLSGNGAYVDARYTDYQNGTCYPNQPTAPAGSPLAPGICVAGSQSLNGYPLQSSPKWRLNGTARFETPYVLRGVNVFGQVNAQYQSRQVFNAVADPNERQPGYTLVNLSAGVRSSDGVWRLSAYGNNVFDKKFIARTIVQIGGAYYGNVVPYDARARYGVALELNF